MEFSNSIYTVCCTMCIVYAKYYVRIITAVETDSVFYRRSIMMESVLCRASILNKKSFAICYRVVNALGSEGDRGLMYVGI